jgi:hypothetical protein
MPFGRGGGASALPDTAAFLVFGTLGGMFTPEGMDRRGMAALTLIVVNVDDVVEKRNIDEAVKVLETLGEPRLWITNVNPSKPGQLPT